MFFARTLINIAKVIQQQIDEEQYDIKKIQGDLVRLQLELELDEITEGEYDIQEAILLEKLNAAHKHNQIK